MRVKTGKAIDETYRISFKFNGSTYYGFKGDTLASALLANDIHLVMRRILRNIADRNLEDMGDISTLADPSVVDKLIKGDKK